ncbi:MAG: IclR family transcriptional regulator [Pyrinomonadaceae bacterium]
MNTRSAVQGTAAFAKSIAVLDMIAESPNPPDIAGLVRRSGFPRGTVHRIVQSLVAEELVAPREDKTFVLAPRIIRLAARALEQNDITRLSESALEALSGKTKETVHFAVFGEGSMRYTSIKDSPHAIRIASSLGDSVAWHASAIGQAVLASLPKPEMVRILDSINWVGFTKHTLKTKSALARRIREICKTGYSVAHQETDLDIECYGVAVRDSAGNPVAGISVSVPLFRHSGNGEDYIKPMLECRDAIEQLLPKV